MSTSVPGTEPWRTSVTAKRTTPASLPDSAVPTNRSATGRAAVQPSGMVVAGAVVASPGAGWAGVGLGASWAPAGAATEPITNTIGAAHAARPSTRRIVAA